jgi:hypothetical protein
MKHIKGFGISILIASIPAAIFPFVFWKLFDLNTSATGRDILPALDNPLELIGFIGTLFFGLPVLLIFSAIGTVIPFEVDSDLLMAIAISVNVLLWAVPLEIFRRLVSYLGSSSKSVANHEIKA